ncbi:MAG: sporulation protein Cse60 [Bacilli bacterium]|nr:sporulation protein Cse60 [Bacilli bacterium]
MSWCFYKCRVEYPYESHELDLEEAINCFISTGVEIIDIKFQTAIQIVGEDQIYCFSALIMYN